jgi:hypothetical protein
MAKNQKRETAQIESISDGRSGEAIESSIALLTFTSQRRDYKSNYFSLWP